MNSVDVLIVGGGPCGLSAAIECQNAGLNALVIEKGNVVNAIYNYPTHQTFFSTSEKLAIGDVPFIIEERKPRRNQALVYYREVVKAKKIAVNSFEQVLHVTKNEQGLFTVKTTKAQYEAKHVVVATGYYDSPNMLDIAGEALPKVQHYFKEAHPYFDLDVVVIGGKNSAIDAALELNKAGARVTVIYRGADYSPSIKPWVLPEFLGLVRDGEITMHFNGQVVEITEDAVHFVKDGQKQVLKNDHVFAMIGYHPDHQFIREMGVEMDNITGRPTFNPETMETNVENLYIAGVIAAGNEANEIFIENGRFHGGIIAQHIAAK